MLAISKKTYGNGANCVRVDIGSLTLWFSYDTVVAFQDARKYLSDGQYHVRISENRWGTTTGMHLSTIDGGTLKDKRKRLPREEFEKQLGSVLAAHGLIVEQ